MADAFITRRGGGGGAGATLEITGVTGSTVTITNTALGKTFTKTLDAQGKATFKGLASGTWNVVMTDGTRTATGSVVINNEYGTTLRYELDLLLDGVLYPTMGNWTSTTNPKFQNGKLRFTVDAGVFDKTFNSEAFDATNFSTITVIFEKQTNSYGAQSTTFFGLTASKNAAKNNYLAQKEITAATLGTYTLDISDVTGTVYFQCTASGQTYGSCWHEFSKIVLT